MLAFELSKGRVCIGDALEFLQAYYTIIAASAHSFPFQLGSKLLRWRLLLLWQSIARKQLETF